MTDLNWNREELAWCAGFYDGEGSTSIRTVNGVAGVYLYPLASIRQANFETLERFQDATGRIGALAGPYKPSKGSNLPVWTLRYNGFERTQQLIGMLWPWLSDPKREQAHRVFLRIRQYQRPLIQRKRFDSCKFDFSWSN